MLSRIVPVNKEINVVKPVPEEELLSVEVGFNICGTDPDYIFLSIKASPGCI
jgi:hypothetical protein